MSYRLLATDFWYRDMPGSMLLTMEQELLKKIISHIHGDYLIQLGGPSDLSLVKYSSAKHKIYLGHQPHFFNNRAKIIADIQELPFLIESIDIAVVAHVLEFAKNPQSILTQLFEALVPNGYCLILGFNYWSYWNIARLYSRGEFPWRGHFFAISTIKHWLRAQQFRIITSKTACFRPPLHNSGVARNLMFIEPIGQFCFPGMGGFFLIVAQKRVFAMETEAEKQGWRRYFFNPNGYVKPTTRNM